jgi:hypothetical protein
MRFLFVPVFLAAMVDSSSLFAAEYSSVKQLLVRAIDAPDGKANGIVLGQIAEKFKRTTGSSAPVIAEVTTIKSFNQEGCKRLSVRLVQSGVATSEGRLADFGMDYGLNLCRDGSPPTEGMDLEQAGKVLERPAAQ